MYYPKYIMNTNKHMCTHVLPKTYNEYKYIHVYTHLPKTYHSGTVTQPPGSRASLRVMNTK